MEIGRDPNGYFRTPLAEGSRARYAPQETPEGTYRLYLDWLAAGRFDPDLAIFTPETRRFLSSWPMTRGYFDYILLGEYGKAYRVETRGNLALLYFIDDPMVSPHFLRRADGGWQMDIVAEVRNTAQFTGGVYTWTYRGRDDDFSRTFADKLINVLSYVRIDGGDNRPLPLRGNSSPWW